MPDDFPGFGFLREQLGCIPDIFRLQTTTPEVLSATIDGFREVLCSYPALRRDQKVFIQLAVSVSNRSWPGVPSDVVPLTDSDAALMTFASKLAGSPRELSPAAVEALRGSGFTDPQVLEAVAAAALANFFHVLRLGIGMPQAAAMPDRFSSLELLVPKKPHLSVPETRHSDIMPDPDAECVAQVRAGKSDVFEELMNRHHNRVYRTLIGVLGDRDEALDAMQETFLKAFQHLASFEGRSRFSTWLLTIASNAAIQRLRDRKPFESLDENDSDFEEAFRPRQLQAWSDNPEQQYSQAEMRELIERAIMRLAAKYRVVLILRDIEQVPIEETAAAIGLGVPGAKARLLRGRLMLREALAPHFTSA